MKKWENPELSFLGIERTQNEGCPQCVTMFASSGTGSQHYCHRDKILHDANCPSLKDDKHYKDDKCSGIHWNYAHVSKCCCGEHAGDSEGTTPEYS